MQTLQTLRAAVSFVDSDLLSHRPHPADPDLRTEPATASVTGGFASSASASGGCVSDAESESNLRHSKRAERDRPDVLL